MKRKYFVGFFILAVLVCAAYNISYQFGASQSPGSNALITEAPSAAVSAGSPEKLYHYYLKEENGKVSVYLEDGKTLYEYTTIETKSLPAHLQKEIRQGKYLTGEKELYDFLENYSS